jgi:hypothetical protein
MAGDCDAVPLERVPLVQNLASEMAARGYDAMA